MSARQSVLVVDDDAAGRAILDLSLRQAGYSVQSAPGGEEALKLLQERPYDWLVTDGRMSPMDGFELSRRAKSLRPLMRIVMISAIYLEADLHGAPVEKLFTKPVPVDDLIGWLESASGNGRR